MSDNKTTDLVENLTPANGPVDIEQLLDNIENFILKHAVLPKGASAAITLWCLATYCMECFRIFPRLAICSPEKKCGKSTVLDLIEGFVYKPLMTSNMTPASIFRVIELCQPTLLIDEADTFVAGSVDGLTGIINSGHAKSRAFVTRCDGEDNTPRRFSTWSPMVLAFIGELQSTIMDRSIKISLRRKTQQETVSRLNTDLLQGAVKERRQLLKWSIDNKEVLQNNLVEPPSIDNDRAVDNWLPLFTIAKQISDAWYVKCEEAYEALNAEHVEPDISTQLLTDIREVFNVTGEAKITSAALTAALVADKDKPWCEIKRGGPMSQNGLAIMLKKYGIRSTTIRHNGSTTKRGYELKQFSDTFKRYL